MLLVLFSCVVVWNDVNMFAHLPALPDDKLAPRDGKSPVMMLDKTGQKSKIEKDFITHNPMELIFKCCSQKPVDLKILERLLSNSKCVDARLSFVAPLHCSTAARPMALHVAAEHGQKKAVELLLLHGACINADGG